jgi:hypothetical protein
VTEHSRFLVRSVAAAFDAHLDASKQPRGVASEDSSIGLA